MPVAARTLHSVALELGAREFLAAWHPERGTLFLAALSEGRVGDDVAVRIGVARHPLRTTIFGRITAVRRLGRPTLPPGIEMAVDLGSLPAVRLLTLAARGESVSFRERAPRFLHARAIALRRGRDEQPSVTHDVSEGGCGCTWTGPLPAIGEVVEVRVGEGLFASTLRSVVCWTSPGAPAGAPALGLRILGHGRAARGWRSVVSEASRSRSPVT